METQGDAEKNSIAREKTMRGLSVIILFALATQTAFAANWGAFGGGAADAYFRNNLGDKWLEQKRQREAEQRYLEKQKELQKQEHLKSECPEIVQTVNLALKVKDYDKIISYGKKDISGCKNYVEPYDIPYVYWAIGHANYMTDNYNSALASSEMCIKEDYGYIDCHFQRGNILADMGNWPDALKEARLTDALAEDRISGLNQQLGQVSQEDKKVALQALVESLKEIQKTCRTAINISTDVSTSTQPK